MNSLTLFSDIGFHRDQSSMGNQGVQVRSHTKYMNLNPEPVTPQPTYNRPYVQDNSW